MGRLDGPSLNFWAQLGPKHDSPKKVYSLVEPDPFSAGIKTVVYLDAFHFFVIFVMVFNRKPSTAQLPVLFAVPLHEIKACSQHDICIHSMAVRIESIPLWESTYKLTSHVPPQRSS